MHKTHFLVGIVFSAVFVIGGGLPSAAFAQTNSLFGSRGPTGNSTNSFSSNFSLGGGSRSSTTGGNVAAGFSSRGLNFQSGGQRGGVLGVSQGSNRVGFNNAGGNSNSNRRGTNSRNSRGNTRGSARNGGGRQNFGGGRGSDRDFDRRGGRRGRNSRVRNVRPRQRVNFSYPQRSAAMAVDSLRTQFASHAENRPALAGITVRESNGRVTLSGTIDSEENRRLAAIIAKLEPGVTSVDNQLAVQ